MGSRGPRPKPTRAKELTGSWRAKLNKHEPQPPSGAPPCPRWLDKEAKGVWRKLLPMLEASGMITRVDGNALTRYCRMWTRWKRAEEFIEKYGETYPLKDSEGRLRGFMTHPQVWIANNLAASLTKLEQELGLTPSARSRLHVQPREIGRSTASEDEVARFFAVREDPTRPGRRGT